MAMIATLHPVETTTPVNGHSIASIPLNKLIAWDGNVRKTGAEAGLDELTASIAAHGVLQSLVVRKAARGKFAVIAGRRRFRALSRLAEAGTIAHDAPVPCRIVPGSSDATEIGLTENVMRAPMHPADQYEAFRDLVDADHTPADIAARFGIREEAVKRILRLARVSPVVFEAYRGADLNLEQVQAFAVTDDAQAQERVFAELDAIGYDPRSIRRALTRDDTAGTDKRARFVTVAAYEEAGGALKRDLFTEGDAGVFLLDSQLLNRLALEKLEAEAASVRAEGWKWVECALEFGFEQLPDFKRVYPERQPLSEEAEAEQKRLSEEYEALFDSQDEHDEATSARLDAIQERMEELEDSGEAFTPEQLAIAGAVVTIDYDGELKVERGLVRREGLPQDDGTSHDAGSGDDDSPKEKPPFSATLVERLTTHRSTAIGASLMAQPDVALAVTVHCLAVQLLSGSRYDGVLQLKAFPPRSAEPTQGGDALKEAAEHWRAQLPQGKEALWHWCLAQERDTLLKLLAFCVALLVDGVRRNSDRPDCERLTHAAGLVTALKLDMREWFTPTATNYFTRVGRPEVVKAITEAKGIPAKRSWDKLKKAELAAFAEREVAGTGWLPEPIRA